MNLLRLFAVARAKKHLALVIAFLMLVSNTGFAMSVHYCGGKIASVSSGLGEEKGCCGKKADAGKMKCCSTKTVHFKSKTTDGIAKTLSFEIPVLFVAPVCKHAAFKTFEVRDLKKSPSYYCEAHAPPLFKLYHQYVFYA